MAIGTNYTGNLNLGCLDVRHVRAAAKNPPREDSFYSRLENPEVKNWKNQEGRWTIVRIDNSSFDAIALFKAMQTKADGTPFSSKFKEIADARAIQGSEDQDHDLSLFLPLSFIKRTGHIELHVDDVVFDLKVGEDLNEGDFFSESAFEDYKNTVAYIFEAHAAGECFGKRPTPIVIDFDPGDHRLFIRGTGPGMSWGKGIELPRVNGKYVVEMPGDCDEFEFKILLDDNDKQWEEGCNHVAKRGEAQTIKPRFT
jgi:hypothetical protein